jgi:gamma-glutamyltranspeptidase/glutathione hydrolase
MSRSRPRTRVLALSLLLLLLLAAWRADRPGVAGTFPPPVTATQGMVSSAHPLATRAGVEVLQAGGNAFDAAVAVAAALNVVEPAMSGMGGYGTIMVWDAARGQARFLNSSGRIPRGVDPAVYRPPTPDWKANRVNARAISTPGNLNAWDALWRGFGELAWADVLEPAIRLAEEGFELDARVAGLIAGAWDDFPEHVRAFYGASGRPLEAGERLVQRDLARSFRQVAREGPGALHGGPLGEEVDRAMRAGGGFLRLSDLRENEAEWYEPIGIDYRGYRILTASPPANSFPALERLGMMSLVDGPALEHNSAAYLHHYAEITKKAFADRLRWASDPEVMPVPLERLLSAAYWREQVAAIDPERAEPFVYPFTAVPPEGHTTHFVVADRYGNVVSATQTLGNAFGSRIMPEGTGIWLNNSLAYCTFEPPGNPMDAFPGRHKLSGDVPVIVLRDGLPVIAMGTPGGHTIGQTVPQMLMNLIDFGMDIEAALSVPRISFIEPDLLAVERAVPQAVRDRLSALGHEVRPTAGLGLAHGLTIERDPAGRITGFTGAADPRGAGLAEGYQDHITPGVQATGHRSP